MQNSMGVQMCAQYVEFPGESWENLQYQNKEYTWRTKSVFDIQFAFLMEDENTARLSSWIALYFSFLLMNVDPYLILMISTLSAWAVYLLNISGLLRITSAGAQWLLCTPCIHIDEAFWHLELGSVMIPILGLARVRTSDNEYERKSISICIICIKLDDEFQYT